MKSSALDYRCFLYITFMGSQGSCRSYSNTLISWKNQWKISTENGIFTKASCLQLASKQILEKESKSSLSSTREFNSFNSLHNELSSGFHLVDKFSDHFSFYIVNCRDKNSVKVHLQNLNKTFEDFSPNLRTVIIISNASIKNNIVTSILYFCSSQNILAKTIHHIVNINSTEAEFFAIRYRINQVTHLQNVNHIIIIMDVIYSER